MIESLYDKRTSAVLRWRVENASVEVVLKVDLTPGLIDLQVGDECIQMSREAWKEVVSEMDL